ncbi:P-loop containing nucleoside triphosphate hydrolase [Vibrio phage 1.164.O._10N.261.51.A7]|nr:P-loop containing nucleoside triphosphate hydrolase [Vibrio phage 1.164.O._10N.261.51.A7]
MIDLKLKQQEALGLMKTGANVFLTGKAGTGKSFVTDLFTAWAEEQDKNILICAPTGIAALNIGGATIHRTFKLPINYVSDSSHLYSSNEGRALIEAADIVLIDEVSMLRADTFSHVEYKMRESVLSGSAFGGKQIIVVGDFYQLPPVIKNEERADLKAHFGGHYAFECQAWKDAKFKMVELDEVVRQSDLEFVDALNSIREKNVHSNKSLGYVNHNANGDLMENDVVTLCFTNKVAEQINKKELAKIETLPVEFIASVSGTVKESEKPVPEHLELKVGAKVIFCVNDQDGRFVNGTTGYVTGFDGDFIVIDDCINLDKNTWEITEPKLNELTGKIEHDVIGTYQQYPIKLAWAITIHKSQGQTIKGRVHMQMDGSFRPHGALYVALSRCTDINNLSLERELGAYDLVVDESVRTALLSMSLGMTTIEIPAYSIGLFEKLLDVIELNPSENQLNAMLKRLGDWEDKLSCRKF